MFHERLSKVDVEKGFIPHNEIVGWTQGPHGVSRPITGVVIGRELRGVVTREDGQVFFQVDTYIKPTGNEFPLKSIPGSHIHHGWSGKEFEVTQQLSPDFALKLEFSPNIEELRADKALPLLNTPAPEDLQSLIA